LACFPTHFTSQEQKPLSPFYLLSILSWETWVTWTFIVYVLQLFYRTCAPHTLDETQRELDRLSSWTWWDMVLGLDSRCSLAPILEWSKNKYRVVSCVYIFFCPTSSTHRLLLFLPALSRVGPLMRLLFDVSFEPPKHINSGPWSQLKNVINQTY